MLDIGCGRGLVVDYLRSQNINCIGVEIAEVDIPDRLSQFIYTGLNSLDLPSSEINSFDTIMLLDVLEHIENPRFFLEEQLKSYTSAKYVVITLPARNELWSNYDEFYGHFQRYNLKSIEDDILLDGWKIKSASYIFRWIYPVAYLIALFKFMRAVKIKAPSGLSKLIHYFLTCLSVLDFKILPCTFWGTSIICVIKRNE